MIRWRTHQSKPNVLIVIRPYDDKELENQAALVLKELNERKVALITTGKENSAILNDLI